MADHIEISAQLAEAQKLGLIEPGLQSCAITLTINQANRLLQIIKDGGGALSTSQLVERSALDVNTCRIYCRELAKLGYLQKTKEGKQDAVWLLIIAPQQPQRDRSSSSQANSRTRQPDSAVSSSN